MEQKSHQASKNTTGNPTKYDRSYPYYSGLGEDGQIWFGYPIIIFEDQTINSDEYKPPRQLIKYFGGKRFLAYFVRCTDRKIADNNIKYLRKFLEKERKYRTTHCLLDYEGKEDEKSESEMMEAILEEKATNDRNPEEDFRLAECLELRDRVEAYIAGKFDDQGRHSKIFRLFTAGYSLGEIAKKMGMTYCTVRNYQIANWEAAKEYRKMFLE